MKLTDIGGTILTTGAKQTLKALQKRDVQFVYIGSDSDAFVTNPIRDACDQLGVTCCDTYTMEELGQAAHIKVKAAALGIKTL